MQALQVMTITSRAGHDMWGSYYMFTQRSGAHTHNACPAAGSICTHAQALACVQAAAGL